LSGFLRISTDKGGEKMPKYEYRCTKCKKKFTLTLSIKEKGEKKIKCPKCNSSKVTQLITGFFSQTSKKS
jgi:putative FmdB family regulatory protein